MGRCSGQGEGNKDALKRVPWDADFCEKALEFVLESKLPEMVGILEFNRQHTWFSSGHQVVLGLLPALIDVLGDRARFVRLRRDQVDVAYSYSRKGQGPCFNRCIFCICPLDAVARCPMEGGLYAQLSVFQRYLWFADEVECQWQALLHSRPGLKYMTLDWAKVIAPEQVVSVARFVGMDVTLQDPNASEQRKNGHVFKVGTRQRNDTALHAEREEYRRLTALPPCDRYQCIPPI